MKKLTRELLEDMHVDAVKAYEDAWETQRAHMSERFSADDYHGQTASAFGYKQALADLLENTEVPS